MQASMRRWSLSAPSFSPPLTGLGSDDHRGPSLPGRCAHSPIIRPGQRGTDSAAARIRRQRRHVARSADGIPGGRSSGLAVDMPGYGHADPRKPGTIIAQLDAFIDATIADTGAVILMGNSLGACVSVRAASRGSETIRGVIAGDEPLSPQHPL